MAERHPEDSVEVLERAAGFWRETKVDWGSLACALDARAFDNGTAQAAASAAVFAPTIGIYQVDSSRLFVKVMGFLESGTGRPVIIEYVTTVAVFV